MNINFDMDGTLCSLYEVPDWLKDLRSFNTRPYEIAPPLFNFSLFARYIHKLQRLGYKVNIISWSSKVSNDDFDARVAAAKLEWLKKHLPSVEFDEIFIVPYGTPKHTLSSGILFDDEEKNRTAWGDGAYDVDDILNILKGLM